MRLSLQGGRPEIRREVIRGSAEQIIRVRVPVPGLFREAVFFLHEDVLQRAVELAKIAWTATGGDNTQAVLAAGQRSE